MIGNIFRIELQACDPARNIWRFYVIEAERDLFDDLLVTFNYGRIGTCGQTRTHIAPDAAEVVRLVRGCLKRKKPIYWIYSLKPVHGILIRLSILNFGRIDLLGRVVQGNAGV
jgi:predicted DNA-binding WGR domain protein